MLPCAPSETLEQFLRGELPEADTARISEHVKNCLRCQKELDRLSENASLREWSGGTTPAVRPGALEPAPAGLLQNLRVNAVADTPASGDSHPTKTNPTPSANTYDRLGPYQVLGELGRGGMGVVLKAYDPELRRVVAVKVLHPGRCDEKARSRFVREARAAAGLNHDHIVAVYAVANPPDAPPYFSMQYVAGLTLRELIQAQKRLGPREAATLGFEVADGLAAAHRAGLVHRDIKPANIILGSDRNRAMILDFGLVRINETTGGTTQEGALAGTPEYMSPEQIRHPAQVDARSDIYNLGVTLYEALTGEPPFRGDLQMVLQQVLHDEAVPPRRLSDAIPRDLETICLKAMAKELGRRYQTAADMRDDLGRWLKGEPIHARPVGRIEKAWRWCRRKPALAALTAALMLVFASGFAGVTWQWLRADRNYDLAEQRRRKAHLAVNEYFIRVSEDKLLDKPGLQELRKDLLESALRYYQDFLVEWGDDPAMRTDVAATYLNVAKAKLQLGQNAEARAAFDEALARYEALAAANPADIELRARLARAHSDLGQLHAEANAFAEALRALNQARVMQEELIQLYPDEPQYSSDLATNLLRVGNLHYKQGSAKEAMQLWEQARLRQEKLVEDHPKEPKYGINLAATCHNLATAYEDMKAFATALRLHERARELRTELVRLYPTSPEYQAQLADSHHSMGNFHAERREDSAALRNYEQARHLLERLVYDNPAVVSFQWDLALVYYHTALQHRDFGRWAEGIRLHREAQPILIKLSRVNPSRPDYRARLASSYFDTGHMQSQISQQAEAFQAFRDAFPIFDQLVREHSTVVFYQQNLQRCAHNVGNELRRRGRYTEALPYYERSKEVSRNLASKDPSSLASQQFLAFIHQRIAVVYDKLERRTDAEQATADGIQVISPLVDRYPDNLDYGRILAKCHADRGQWALRAKRYEDAERAFEQALAIRLKLVQTHSTAPDVDQEVAMSYHDLGETQRQTGHQEAAVRYFELARVSFAKAIQANSQNLQTHSELGVTLDDLALALAELGRSDEALKLHQQAIESQKSPLEKAPDYIDHRQRLSRHYEHLAELQRALVRPAEAAATTREQLKLWPDDADAHFRAGRELALCSLLVGKDKTQLMAVELAERDRLQSEAVTALGAAVKLGYADLVQLGSDASFDPLRSRDDFKRLLADLKAKTPTNPK